METSSKLSDGEELVLFRETSPLAPAEADPRTSHLNCRIAAPTARFSERSPSTVLAPSPFRKETT